MGDTSIELRINRHQYDALECILTMRGTNTETVIQEQLMELYRQTVPEQERVNIDNQIESERLAAERLEAELRRFSVFRITEKGSVVCLECNHPLNFMQSAYQARRYLRHEMDPQPGTFAEYFLTGGTLISEEKFSVLMGERIEGSQNITGLFDIDLDSRMFHTAHHLNGWASFRLKDVTTAAYYAYRKSYCSNDNMWKIFLDYLDGRQIAEAATAMSMEM
jgi:hypothetical protein